jgi:hypothetical protein
MVLASASSDIVTGVCMALVIGMAGMLVFRATRSRSQDQDEQE